MTAAELTTILQIVAVLTPEAIKLANRLEAAFQSASPEERDRLLTELANSLKPMEPLP